MSVALAAGALRTVDAAVRAILDKHAIEHPGHPLKLEYRSYAGDEIVYSWSFHLRKRKSVRGQK